MFKAKPKAKTKAVPKGKVPVEKQTGKMAPAKGALFPTFRKKK